ncbi:hypothetical protein QP028_13900 [Corynebacterium suedekumii]|nr:hypothetical protein QP028_13900 [Corynebacterium suedekumii]
MTRLLIRLHTTLRARLVEDNPAALMVTLLMYLYAFGGLLFLSIAAFNGVDQSHWSVLAGMAGIGTLAFLGATLIIPSGENALRPAALLRPARHRPGPDPRHGLGVAADQARDPGGPVFPRHRRRRRRAAVRPGRPGGGRWPGCWRSSWPPPRPCFSRSWP